MRLLFSLYLSGCGLPAGDPTRPDILLISIDSLRADHLSSYGYERPTSPRLDALAASGLRFTHSNATSSWTLPSHLSMLTGLWPTQHQVIEDDLVLSAEVPLIQEALGAVGFQTAAFVSSWYVSAHYGFNRGFSVFRDDGLSLDTNLQHPVNASAIVDRTLEWAGALPKGKPAFVFLHLYDVHYPYLPPKPYDEAFDQPPNLVDLRYTTYKYFLKHRIGRGRMTHIVAQYDESIRWVDAEIGRLLDAWDRPATVIVTADHGEEFGERHSWGHGHTLYAEQLRVPLLVAGPGIAPAVRDEPVSSIDLAPTIAALAAVTFVGQGVDLRGQVPARALLAETSRFRTARLSIEEAGWRLDLDLERGRRRLYDQTTDPKEKKNLSGVHPERVQSLEHALWAALGTPWAWAGPGSLSSTGFMWQDGELRGRELQATGEFGLYPSDATLSVEGQELKGASAWASGSRLPGLSYTGEKSAGLATLDDATKKMLEELGYVQEDREAEAGGAPPAEDPGD